MKIIDLLNKIANGEDVPYKIKINGIIYIYQGDDYLYVDEDKIEYWLFSEGYTDKFEWLGSFLKTKIEIAEEEKKIPEKIKSNGKEFYCDNIDSWIDKEKTSAYCEYLMNKYNDLIDYLKSKGDE